MYCTHPATKAVEAGERGHQNHLQSQNGGVEGEGGEGRVVKFPHTHLDELWTLTDRPESRKYFVSGGDGDDGGDNGGGLESETDGE